MSKITDMLEFTTLPKMSNMSNVISNAMSNAKTSEEQNYKYKIVHRCVLQYLKIKVCRPMQEVLKLQSCKFSNLCRVQYLQGSIPVKYNIY